MQLSKIISVFFALVLGAQAAPAPVPGEEVARAAPPKDENWKFKLCNRDVAGEAAGDGKDENWKFCVES